MHNQSILCFKKSKRKAGARRKIEAKRFLQIPHSIRAAHINDVKQTRDEIIELHKTASNIMQQNSSLARVLLQVGTCVHIDCVCTYAGELCHFLKKWCKYYYRHCISDLDQQRQLVQLAASSNFNSAAIKEACV